MSELAKEKEAAQQRLREAVEAERNRLAKIIAEKGSQYDTLKAQFIDCEQDVTQSRVHLRDLDKANTALREQIAALNKELTMKDKEMDDLKAEKARV